VNADAGWAEISRKIRYKEMRVDNFLIKNIKKSSMELWSGRKRV